MAQATPSTGVCPGPRRGGGESSPFCGAKGGRGAQRRRGFIRPNHRRTRPQPPPSLSPQRRGRGSGATAGDARGGLAAGLPPLAGPVHNRHHPGTTDVNPNAKPPSSRRKSGSRGEGEPPGTVPFSPAGGGNVQRTKGAQRRGRFQTRPPPQCMSRSEAQTSKLLSSRRILWPIAHNQQMTARFFPTT